MVGNPDILDANAAAEHRLADVLEFARPELLPSGSAPGRKELKGKLPRRNLTLLLMPNEVNAAHGTGILAYRLLRDVPDVAVVRTFSHYDNTCLLDCPDIVLPADVRTRHDIFKLAADSFSEGQLKQVVCIPWYPQELILAIALKRIFGVPFVLYVMDDNCLYTGYLPRELMAEAMAEADVVLAISAEMQNAYQDAFRQKMWILPPLLEPSLLLPDGFDPDAVVNPAHGVVVGNIWRQSSLDLFCDALVGSGLTVDWYCNTGAPGWLTLDRARLSEAGITFRSPLPEPELVEVLRKSAFAILPSSTLQGDDESQNIGRLSLPSRVPFITASAATPIIVLGSNRTSAGAFVEHFGAGAVSDYNAEALAAAARRVTSPGFRRNVAEVARRIGPVFSAAGMSDWVTRAAETGRPPDDRFEAMLSYRRNEFGYYVPPEAPKHVFHDFRPAYESLERLKGQGLDPEFVLDVGASTGVWSATIAPLFPDARYLLVDPLFDRYPANEVESHLRLIPKVDSIAAAVSDRSGSMSIEVSDNLYGSSLMGIGSGAARDKSVEVRVTTLEEIAQEHGLKKRGLIKIDVQFAEHLVVDGGERFLSECVDCIVIELTVERVHPEMKTMLELLNRLDGLGFRWADQAGEWRSLGTGRLEQVDVVLVHRDFLPPLPMVVAGDDR